MITSNNINTDFDKAVMNNSLRLLKNYLKIVLDNKESKKIFQFLCLNFTYMFIQLIYGAYTNSLGLISDGNLRVFIFLYVLIAIFNQCF